MLTEVLLCNVNKASFIVFLFCLAPLFFLQNCMTLAVAYCRCKQDGLLYKCSEWPLCVELQAAVCSSVGLIKKKKQQELLFV